MNIHVGIWNFDGKEIDGGLFARASDLPQSASRPAKPNSSRRILSRSCTTQAEQMPSRSPAWPGKSPLDLLGWTTRQPPGTRKPRVRRSRSSNGHGCSARDCTNAGVSRHSHKLLEIGRFVVCAEARRELVLARDFVGTRTLYYRIQKNSVMWSTCWKRCSSPPRSPSRVIRRVFGGLVVVFP